MPWTGCGHCRVWPTPKTSGTPSTGAGRGRLCGAGWRAAHRSGSRRSRSAAAASLLDTPDTADVLARALSKLNEQEVVDVTTSRSELDDVMLTLVERFAGKTHPVPARIMSDGSLRFLAILVSLLQAPTVDTMPEPLASEDALGQTT